MSATRPPIELGLPTGGAVRRTGDALTAVVLLNGTVRAAKAGVWGASAEWLTAQLAPAFPGLAFYEVRYRIRSWRAIESCVADGRAALASVRADGRTPAILIGYSGGGAVALALAADPGVAHVIGLAPWLPRQLDPQSLAGRRVVAIHGSLDGLPLIPGTSPRASRAAIDRLAARGADAEHVLVSGGVHQIAVRAFGRVLPAPRASAWREMIAGELRRAQDDAGTSR